MGLENSKISLTHEVVESSAKAKLIAEGYSQGSQYIYKANAVLIGHSPLRPCDPIYLAGLRDNMSGVWVVISVTHVFNDKLKYTMRVHLGSNDILLGIKAPNNFRDVSDTLVKKYPKILGEQDSLFTVENKDSKRYVVSNLNPRRLKNQTLSEPSWVRDPVKEFIDNRLPTTSKHVNPFEHFNPGTNNSQNQPKWDTE